MQDWQESVSRVQAAQAHFRRKVVDPAFDNPRTGIILGTGMGGIAAEIQQVTRIPFQELPGFAPATIAGHRGELLAGWLNGQPVLALNGRSHLYEGHSLSQIQFPVWLLHSLGIANLIIGNASGGVHSRFSSGDVMLIEDQLDLMFRVNLPLGIPADSGAHQSSGFRLPQSALSLLPDRLAGTGRDLADRILAAGKTGPYSRVLMQTALEIGREHRLGLQQGVYAALTGPNYETRAEYRMLRRLGADVVGMSTIPEANLAASLGISVCGLSTITNVANPDEIRSTSHDEVIAAVHSAERTLKTLLFELVAVLD